MPFSVSNCYTVLQLGEQQAEALGSYLFTYALAGEGGERCFLKTKDVL